MWPLGVALTQSSTPFPAPHQVSISLPTPLNYATAFLVQRPWSSCLLLGETEQTLLSKAQEASVHRYCSQTHVSMIHM